MIFLGKTKYNLIRYTLYYPNCFVLSFFVEEFEEIWEMR